MYNINIEGTNLGEVFSNMKSGEEITVTLEVVRRNSVGNDVVERTTKVENVNIDILRKKITKIVLLGVGVIVALNMTLNIAENANSPLRMEAMSREIGSIVRQVDDPGRQTILSQNTHRNENGPYYSHEGIAKDLLSLDSSVFDYALCSVCNDMGSNLNNNVGVQGMSNIDSVVYYLKMYSSMEGKYFNQYVSNMFKDVNSLNEYLVKKNYVDGGGNPSLDAFKSACDNNAQEIYDVVHSQVSNKGANL